MKGQGRLSALEMNRTRDEELEELLTDRFTEIVENAYDRYASGLLTQKELQEVYKSLRQCTAEYRRLAQLP